jgi:hypothetical protein
MLERHARSQGAGGGGGGGGGVMTTRTKNILGVLVVIFVLYAIIVSPQQAADFVRTAFQAIADGVRAIFDFFDAVING